MAAAVIVPLIANLAPAVISLITNLVHRSAPRAEQQLGTGTGPAKFGQVFNDVMGALTSAANAGQIDKALPADDSVKLIIQSVVTSMKALGLLDSATAASVVAPGTAAPKSFVLAAGGSVTISAV